MKTKYLNIGLSFLVAGILVGCGSSSGSDDGDDSPDAETSACTATPLADYQHEGTFNGTTFKAGANGSLTYENGELELNGVDSLTITKITTVEELSFVFTDIGTVTGTITQDTDSGIEHMVGHSSVHGSFDCTATYDITMPLTLNNTWDLEDVTDLFSDDRKISTTCEDWLVDDFNDEDPISGCALLNYTVTDSSSETHYISQYYSFAEATDTPDEEDVVISGETGDECVTFVDLDALYSNNMITLVKGNETMIITIGEGNDAMVQYAIDGTIEWQSPYFKYSVSGNEITFNLTTDEQELFMTEGLSRIMPPSRLSFIAPNNRVQEGDNVTVNGVEYPVTMAFTHVFQALEICPVD